jgi:hypothetical protein
MFAGAASSVEMEGGRSGEGGGQGLSLLGIEIRDLLIKIGAPTKELASPRRLYWT